MLLGVLESGVLGQILGAWKKSRPLGIPEPTGGSQQAFTPSSMSLLIILMEKAQTTDLGSTSELLVLKTPKSTSSPTSTPRSMARLLPTVATWAACSSG